MYTAAAIFNSDETRSIIHFLQAHAYQNLHTRKPKQVNKTRVLKYLHGMKLKNSKTIQGYLCDVDGTEIEYELSTNGKIKYKNLVNFSTKEHADSILEKEKKIVLKRITEIPFKGPIRRTPGQFYLRRCKDPKLSVSARASIDENVLSYNFVKTMINWKFEIIRAGIKSKK